MPERPPLGTRLFAAQEDVAVVSLPARRVDDRHFPAEFGGRGESITRQRENIAGIERERFLVRGEPFDDFGDDTGDLAGARRR